MDSRNMRDAMAHETDAGIRKLMARLAAAGVNNWAQRRYYRDAKAYGPAYIYKAVVRHERMAKFGF